MFGTFSPFVALQINTIITFFFCGFFLMKYPVPSKEMAYIYLLESIPTLGILIYTYYKQKTLIDEAQIKDNNDIEIGEGASSESNSKTPKQFSENFLLYVVMFSFLAPIVLLFGGMMLWYDLFVYEVGVVSFISSFLLILSILLYVGNDITYFCQKLMVGRV